jgi:hypothetical protein
MLEILTESQIISQLLSLCGELRKQESRKLKEAIRTFIHFWNFHWWVAFNKTSSFMPRGLRSLLISSSGPKNSSEEVYTWVEDDSNITKGSSEVKAGLVVLEYKLNGF